MIKNTKKEKLFTCLKQVNYIFWITLKNSQKHKSLIINHLNNQFGKLYF